MIVIKHGNGWSASNEAYIDTRSQLIKENGKIKEVKRIKYCILKSPYTVTGKLNGNVKFAIKDEGNGNVSCFNGVVDNIGIRILSDSDSLWMKTIK